jgi:uncharacterized membrane protein
MATFGMVTEVASDPRARIADRVFATAATVGGVCGAIAGAIIGAALGIGHPTIGGVLGTMLGSAVAVAFGAKFILPKKLARLGK